MAILAECPICYTKQATKNRLCTCGEDLNKAKRSKRVRYRITYRLPRGKQRKECVGDSIEKARDAEGKGRSQKREGRIFDMLPGTDLTLNGLIEWYLGFPKVANKENIWRIETCMKNFSNVLGERMVNELRL